jgi:hypothetical protein
MILPIQYPQTRMADVGTTLEIVTERMSIVESILIIKEMSGGPVCAILAGKRYLVILQPVFEDVV